MHLRVFTCSMLLLLCACEPNVVSVASGLVGSPIGELVDPEDPNNAKAVKIVSGGFHVCALLASNQVKCWGDNESGQCYLKSARNASKKPYDVSNAQFSKITAASFFTCGILKGGVSDGIPVCFGKEEQWLDVPDEKVKDLAAGLTFTCFIKNDGKLGCVGTKVMINTKAGATIYVNAEDLPKHGLDAFNENLDFSQKIFTSVKAGVGRVCAQDADGLVHCMGSNIRGTGLSIAQKVSDYHVRHIGTSFLDEQGKLVHGGDGYGFNILTNISQPKTLKYKKLCGEKGLLTAPGNSYDNGAIMPENTLIPYSGETEEGVLDFVLPESSRKIERVSIRCLIKENHKIICRPHLKSPNPTQEEKDTLIIKDLPTELAY